MWILAVFLDIYIYILHKFSCMTLELFTRKSQRNWKRQRCDFRERCNKYTGLTQKQDKKSFKKLQKTKTTPKIYADSQNFLYIS